MSVLRARKNSSIILCLGLAWLFLFLACPELALAQAEGGQFWGGQQGVFSDILGLATHDPRIIIIKIIRLLLGFLGIVVLSIILYAGYLWMTAGGREEQINTAKKWLRNGLIGLIIIFSAFSLASFAINRLCASTGACQGSSSDSGGGGTGVTRLGAIANLGNCAVQSVYPAPNQKDVPRNSSLIVTFKAPIDQTSLGTAGQTEQSSVMLFPQDRESEALVNLAYQSVDERTFVLTPPVYLGSADDNTVYIARLGANIKDKTGRSIFAECRNDIFEWTFTVSNRLDLTPPQVLSGGIWPATDNEADNYDLQGGARIAQGSFSFLAQPQARRLATATVSNLSATRATLSRFNTHLDLSTTYNVSIVDNGQQAELKLASNKLGSAKLLDGAFYFPGYFALVPSGSLVVGNAWNISVKAEIQADYIEVGAQRLVFVSDSIAPKQIPLGSNPRETAERTASVLNGLGIVDAELGNGAQILVHAKRAGRTGNNISLISSNPDKISVSRMSGGQDIDMSSAIRDRRDKARNAIIRVDFSEAVNPLSVSGNSTRVADTIRVLAGARSLSGQFILSNSYRTLEFIPDEACGRNSCGRTIYCLPASSDIRIEVLASPLAGCLACERKSPFSQCRDGHCVDEVGHFHPLADPGRSEGVRDLAMNSLDGNRDAYSAGPTAFYNENDQSGKGDSYSWSFWTSAVIDSQAPLISAIQPGLAASAVSRDDPFTVLFNKPMSARTLNSGREDDHYQINVYSNGAAPGYWVEKHDVDNNNDLEADATRAQIKHSTLAESTDFDIQIGSGVEDAYQNCFRPSSGPGQSGGDCQGTPSCCDGLSRDSSVCE